MKRSQINRIIADAKDFFAKMNFYLPPYAFWNRQQWQDMGEEASEIRKAGLGWDITDFGYGDFAKFGLVLFNLRNGFKVGDTFSKTYCEKIMLVQEMQYTPMHFHWQKTEDIINRGGGNLLLKLYNATEDEQLADTPVTFQQDGVTRTVEAGGIVTLSPGESITLTPGLYHSFHGEPGTGPVMVGEVSTPNDDVNDNRFFEPLPRFPEIEEDAAPEALLVGDYEVAG